MSRVRRVAGFAVVAAACSGDSTAPVQPAAAPPGADVSAPFPIDRGDEGAETPGTYKGLWLRLVDNGQPTVTTVRGVIGLVCVGMSNGNQECQEFIQQLQSGWGAQVNTAVLVANCAVGGHAIERWIDPAYDDVLWDDCLNRKIAAAGIAADQIRVLYHKAADQFLRNSAGAMPPLYPAGGSDFETFRTHLGQFAARVKVKFPSVQAVYTSSRSYGGWANTPDRGEPHAYEEGHALNSWLRDNPSVDGVWYGWGAYLWASECGTGYANASGTCYVREDYVADGVHPSTSGRLKIAQLMQARLLRDAWYRR